MKKRIALLCAALLALSMIGALAQAETKTETIYLEGMPHEITMTKQVSPLGYTLWYDPEILTPQPQAEGQADRYTPTQLAAEQAEMQIYRLNADKADLDATKQEAVQLLANENIPAQPIDTTGLFNGAQSFGVSGINEKELREYYGVKTPAGIYMVFLRYPLEALDGWGARAYRMLQLLTFGQ